MRSSPEIHRRLLRRTLASLLVLLAAAATHTPSSAAPVSPLPTDSPGTGGPSTAGHEAAAPTADDRAARIAAAMRLVLRDGREAGAFPGAYAVIGSRSGVIAEAGVGSLDWSASPAPDAHTLWDLASLTKVVALTTSVMALVDEQRLTLDTPVQRVLPEWTGRHKDRVTVRHLLTHSGGLPSWRPFYREALTPDAMRAQVLSLPLDTVPGARYLYSDIGAILLGMVVERASGESLDAFVERRVLRPLGMQRTGYRPDVSLHAHTAPTELDPWRGRHLRGEVHDENAFALGGVSGHAGLFGTAADLSRFARALLGGGALDGVRVLDASSVALFSHAQDPALSHRALGWETPNGGNSAGRRLSPRAFGHTGFTGTSLWIDPERDLFVLLLTNRVNPTRENGRIARVRSRLADAVVEAADGPAPPRASTATPAHSSSEASRP